MLLRRYRQGNPHWRSFPALVLFLTVAVTMVEADERKNRARARRSVHSQELRVDRSMLVDRLRRLTRRPLVCGDDRLRREARSWAVSSVDFELDPNGTSHIAWPFVQDDWNVVTGSVFHVGDDYYADDWNWGVGDDDEGKLAMAAAPGYVIFAGRKPNGEPFDGYGKQVVVQVVDEVGDRTGFAYRYAHLESIAVETGDYVHFGSEIGTVGGTGEQDDSFSPHLHSVLYKNIYETAGGVRSGIENLRLGFSPSASLSGGASLFAAAFFNDGAPYSQNEENLPCSTWNGDKDACNAHSILFGGQFTQDCAYYLCSDLCLPRGTSNCRAGCEQYCNDSDADDSDESLPCHTWNDDVDACNDHSILFGNQVTRDCAYYLDTDKCRPRGTSNCLAGILSYCEP